MIRYNTYFSALSNFCGLAVKRNSITSMMTLVANNKNATTLNKMVAGPNNIAPFTPPALNIMKYNEKNNDIDPMTLSVLSNLTVSVEAWTERTEMNENDILTVTSSKVNR